MEPQTGASMNLLDFILESKNLGYASGGEGQEKTFDDGSRGFEFTRHGYRYVDRYYGFNPFTGTEHIFAANGPLLWAMNYYGLVLAHMPRPDEGVHFSQGSHAISLARISVQRPGAV